MDKALPPKEEIAGSSPVSSAFLACCDRREQAIFSFVRHSMKLLGSLRCFDNKECATDEKQSIPSCQFSNSQLRYAAPQGGPLTIAASVGGSLGGTSPPLPMWAPPGGGAFSAIPLEAHWRPQVPSAQASWIVGTSQK